MGKIKGDSMLKTQISKKYKIVALNLADTLHKYPDEFWELLSDFYYHHEMAEILSAPFDDPRKDFIDENTFFRGGTDSYGVNAYPGNRRYQDSAGLRDVPGRQG